MPCVHHWMVPSPGAPTNVGRCRKCRAKREFPGIREADTTRAQMESRGYELRHAIASSKRYPGSE
jgi:hypothetical protein